MSIINDALKKTQEKLAGKKGPAKEPQKTQDDQMDEKIVNVYEKLHKKRDESLAESSGSKSGKAKPAARFSPVQKFFLVILILGLAFLVGRQYMGEDFMETLQVKIKQMIPKKTVKIERRIYLEGELFLNGTAIVGDNKTAIINDRIYQVGDAVQGLTIQDITAEGVTLVDSEGEITTLKRQLP